MKRLLFTILLIILIFPWTRATAAETEEPAEPVFRVNKIDIVGAIKEREKTIRKTMRVKPATWKNLLPWKKKQKFNEEELDADVQRIQKLYEQWGYYSADVNATVAKNEQKKEVNIQITIDEGQPTHISSVEIKGIEDLSQKRQTEIRSRIHLYPGEVFEQQAYEKSRQEILDYLGNKGFAKAEVDWEAIVVKSTRRAIIELTITPGKRYRFGHVTITGLKNIDSKVITSRLTFKEGEWYTADAVRNSQRNIFQLGPFNLVTINMLDPDPGRPEYLPVEIVTKAKKEQAVSFGVGYGTEDNARVKMAWTHRNFFGQARSFSFTGKYSSITRALEGSFVQPYFYGGNQSLLDTFGRREDDLVSYKNVVWFNELAVTRKFSDSFSMSLGYIFEFNELDTVEVHDPQDQAQEGSSDIVTGPRFSLRYDTRDNILDPTKGFYATTSFDYASQTLGSEISYIRVIAEGRHYLKLPRKLVLASRLLGGAIEPVQGTREIPIYKRFFSGGSNSVRGYPFQKLGPLDDSGLPFGGRTLLEGSVELRYPIWGDLRGVVFVDAGEVNPDAFAFDASEVRFTSGFGLRYKTPIGPIRGDIGWQLNPEPGLSKQWNFYISVGQAF